MRRFPNEGAIFVWEMPGSQAESVINTSYLRSGMQDLNSELISYD